MYTTDAVVNQKEYGDIPSDWKRIINVRIGDKYVDFVSRLRDGPPKLVLKKVPKKYNQMIVFVEKYVSSIQ